MWGKEGGTQSENIDLLLQISYFNVKLRCSETDPAERKLWRAALRGPTCQPLSNPISQHMPHDISQTAIKMGMGSLDLQALACSYSLLEAPAHTMKNMMIVSLGGRGKKQSFQSKMTYFWILCA